MKNLLSYAASMSNPPKSYGGSIQIATEVLKYRSRRMDELGWPKAISYENAVTIIEKEILEIFGPKR